MFTLSNYLSPFLRSLISPTSHLHPSSDQLPPISRLPPEILDHILSLSHDPFHPITTLSASLVCSAWKDIAQRVLFQDVVIPVLSLPLDSRVSRKSEMKRWELWGNQKNWEPRKVRLSGREGSKGLNIGSKEVAYCKGAIEVELFQVSGVEVGFMSHPGLERIEHLITCGYTTLRSKNSLQTPSSFPKNLKRLTLHHSINVLSSLQAHYGTLATITCLSITLNPSHHLSTTKTALDNLDLFALDLQRLSSTLRRSSLTLVSPRRRHHSALRPLFDALPSLSHLTLEIDSIYAIDSLDVLGSFLPPSVTHISILFSDWVPSQSEVGGWCFKFLFDHLSNEVMVDSLPNLSRLDLVDVRRQDLLKHEQARNLVHSLLGKRSYLNFGVVLRSVGTSAAVLFPQLGPTNRSERGKAGKALSILLKRAPHYADFDLLPPQPIFPSTPTTVSFSVFHSPTFFLFTHILHRMVLTAPFLAVTLSLAFFARAEAPPNTLALILPQNATYISNTTSGTACYGWVNNLVGASGFSRSVNLTVTLPNGTTQGGGEALNNGCQDLTGSSVTCMNANQAGTYRLDAIITVGLPTDVECSGNFTYQTETLSGYWTMLAPDVAHSGVTQQPYTTTETLKSQMTGSVVATGSVGSSTSPAGATASAKKSAGAKNFSFRSSGLVAATLGPALALVISLQTN
ncbi:hypothetical protein P7C70_g1936, partial [Phenoliferia sp. Uapishka_3]